MRKVLVCFLFVFLILAFYKCNKILKKARESIAMQNDPVKEMNSLGLKRVSESISKNIRNEIKLNSYKVNEKEIPLGETKIGGKPDVPDNFIWPKGNSGYLSFIAQINLEKASKYDLEKVLPSKGFLYFFYDSKQEAWGFDPKDVGSWRVIFYEGNASELKRIDFPINLPEEDRFSACKVDMKSEKSYPAWDSIYIDELNLNEKEQEAYFDFYEGKIEDSFANKILGHPDQIQGDMQLECQLVSNGLYCGDASGYNDPRRKELEKVQR